MLVEGPICADIVDLVLTGGGGLVGSIQPECRNFRASLLAVFRLAVVIPPLRNGSGHRPGRWSELCQSSEILGGGGEEELVARA